MAKPLPAPGAGHTGQRLRALFDIAVADLELARLAEAHHDAHAIAAELDHDLVDGALYGVWAASGPDPLQAGPCGVDHHLVGTLPWCSGIGVVDRALVTAGDLLFDVAVADGKRGESLAPWMSPAFAVTGTGSMTFDLVVSDVSRVGSRGDYLARPGFWHGAICVAACWAGGARGLVDRHLARWRRDDPHALAHLGGALAWSDALEAVLERAAAEIDRDPGDASAAQVRARGVRHVIDRMSTRIIDDLGVGAGPEPLAFDHDILARTQQLQLYLRQCHGERDIEPVGQEALSRR
ncbi:MAG: hypothetical protein ABIR32_18965 [Ilumatobacteraceae bacterium]